MKPDLSKTNDFFPPTQTAHRGGFFMPKTPLNTFTDESITAVVQKLPPLLVELWHERSAIREFDGALPRNLSEALALIDVIRLYPLETLSALIQK